MRAHNCKSKSSNVDDVQGHEEGGVGGREGGARLFYITIAYGGMKF